MSGTVDDHWEKIVAEKAIDVIDADEMDPASLAINEDGMRPEAFIEALCVAGKWPDAVLVMSRILPRREAVWWACVSARLMKSIAGDKEEMTALEAAEQWVYKPTDENRRRAFMHATDSKQGSAGALAAFAAAFSAQNLPLAEGHEPDLPPSAFPHTIRAAVMLAAGEAEKNQILEQFQGLIASGKDIACGGNGTVKEQSS